MTKRILIGGLLWNWYGFPTVFMLANILDETISFALAGAVLAAIVKKP